MKRDTIGPYKIIDKLGEGAFGIVWKVQNHKDNEVRAVKEIAKKKITPELMENLLAEVQICFKLDHKNIAKCYNTMESKKNYFIIFEFCDGGDLEDYIKAVDKLDITKAFTIIKQLKDGFKHLQEQKILHRDIKPENILLTGNGDDLTVKISDFGCSKDSVMGFTICGTPKYMAMEVMKGDDKYNYKADMWSMGLVFWQLIFGYKSFPFTHTSREVLRKDITKYSGDKLRFPKFPVYPDAIYDFFRKVLHMSPAKRLDKEEFFKHPFFQYSGNEKEIQDSLEGIDLSGKKSNFSDFMGARVSNFTIPMDDDDLIDTNESDSKETLSPIESAKKTYKLKTMEITLIKGVADDLSPFLEESWDEQFYANFCCLVIIILKKAQNKTEMATKTLDKKQNAFKVTGFKELIKSEKETEQVKKELSNTKKLIKKADDGIYSKFVKRPLSKDFLQEVNSLFYKKADNSKKHKFINTVWKFIKNNHDVYVEDFEQERFGVLLRRIELILKGKVAEKMDSFY